MSLADDVTRYYAARAPVYDTTAGYADPEAEQLRLPIKARYQEMFEGRDVLEIACGTGYWTQVVGAAAKSVFAFDINPSLVAIAKDRCKRLANVKFAIADAYSLEGVPDGFTAAFAIWWWSHVPKSQIRTFLSALHGRLTPGALVLFVDQLPYDAPARRRDSEGNLLERRSLPDGHTFEIVKNFPTREEIMAALHGLAEKVEYLERPEEKSWNLMYRTSKESPSSAT